MIFLYDRKLAFKYLLFAVFLIMVIIATSPLLMLIFLLIVMHVILAWLAIATLFRAAYMMSNRIILSEEGISFYRFSRRDKTIPWKIIDNYTVSGEKVVIKVADKFIYITSELKEFNLFRRFIKEILDMPVYERGKELPSREALEGISDPALIKVMFEPASRSKLKIISTETSSDMEYLGGDDTEIASKSIALRNEESYIDTGTDLEFFGDPNDR
jgi:energy-coupling factor transporter transmembrane protein EcfT